MMNMDPVIWSKIPDHVLDHILSFLPSWSIIKFRCVSRKWRENLESANFVSKWSKYSPAEVLFLMFTVGWRTQAAAAYNPLLNKWHLVPLFHTSDKETINDYRVITSAGGLVCIEEVAWPNRPLVVSNPMNGSYKKLPPMLDMKSPYVVGMIVNPDGSGYRVLVAQDGPALISQHYDSKSNSWKMNMALDSRVAMVAGMTSIGGNLLCLSWPLGLVAYDIEGATWCNMEVDMPSSITSPHLIQNNGELFLVAGMEEYGQMTSIQIWKVDLQEKECLNVGQMPAGLFQTFSWTGGGGDLFCVGEAGYVCFSDGITPSILVFHMNSSRWWWVPPCPFQISSPKVSRKYAYRPLVPLGFSLKPCFTVIA